MANLKGPKFIQYFQPVLEGLRELGSSAKPKEVYGWIAEHHEIPQAELEGTTKGGQSKFENKVGWARFYLAKAGLIDTEQRGVWVLTEKGRATDLSHEDRIACSNKSTAAFKIRKKAKGKSSQNRLTMTRMQAPRTKRNTSIRTRFRNGLSSCSRAPATRVSKNFALDCYATSALKT